jgi:anaerobic ribonucleoside-triphosphate reductase activating protein
MRYSGIIKNDLAAAPGVSLTFFTQGCPHHCPGCHNPNSWSFDGGEEFTPDTLQEIIDGLHENNINRPLCIMGGEPLCQENLFLVALIIKEVKEKFPDTPIYIWTGYLYEDLLKNDNVRLKYILERTDYLIDGPYIESLRDLTLPMRGSSN